MQKPSDLLLNVIDFLGILVPGAVFVVLYGGALSSLFGISASQPQQAMEWVPPFLLAYVAGHALLGLSVPLNDLAARFPKRETTLYFDAVADKVNLPPKVSRTRDNVFYAAFSQLRLGSPAAIAEVERQTAEYKLFRCLALLAAIDVFYSVAAHSAPSRTVAAVLVSLGALWRFVWLYDWSHRLAYDFYLQSRPQKSSELRRCQRR